MPGDADRIAAGRNERGLARTLTASQQAMVAIGGGIGTGLFLGTGLSIGVAGPAVIVSYAIAAILASARWVPGMRFTVLAGPPWLLALAAGYWYSARLAPPPRPASPQQGVDA